LGGCVRWEWGAYDPSTFAVLVVEVDTGVDCKADRRKTEYNATVFHVEWEKT
jgi:hypothetical protein